MKKILIRGGISPLDNVNSEELLLKDFSGSNIGNYLYQYSIFRTLCTDDTQLYVDNYASNIKNAEQINKNYNQYILALADAFREDFIPQLKEYTNLIKKLEIPVIIVGVGLRAPYDTTLEEEFVFDNEVREFINAVLEKSTIVGVRGQITADYLSKLGFREGVDHQVIGCPSMYAHGESLNIKSLELDKSNKIALNLSEKSAENCVSFINNLTKEFRNYTFIPQIYDEFLLTYGGGPSIKSNSINYPSTLEHKMYEENKVKYFPNLQPWLKFMRETDLSIGTRLHGNIAATISGTPNITITTDARTRELAEYHHLPSIPYFEIEDNHDLKNIVENMDLQSAAKQQPKNFKNYIEFLDKNQIDHIYQNDNQATNTKFDETFSNGEYEGAIPIISHCMYETLVKRLRVFNENTTQRTKRLNNNKINSINAKYKFKIKQLELEIDFLKNKSV